MAAKTPNAYYYFLFSYRAYQKQVLKLTVKLARKIPFFRITQKEL